MPWDGGLVGADVPVFGVAYAEDFLRYRLEFGVGPKPVKWFTIKVSTVPQTVDPWAAGKVAKTFETDAQGNLGQWNTDVMPGKVVGHTLPLSGVHTLRLTVETKSGKTAVASRIVNVTRSVLRSSGGIAASRDGRAFLHVEKRSILMPYMLLALTPVDKLNPSQIPLKPAFGFIPLGAVYELRPPGTVFLSPATLRMAYDAKTLSRRTRDFGVQKIAPERVGIYAYMPVEELWQRLPHCRVDAQKCEVTAPIAKSTRYLAYYAIMADVQPPAAPTLQTISRITESPEITLTGTAEPHATIEILAATKVVATAQASADGKYNIPAVPVRIGSNDFTARAVDAAGNTSPASQPLTVTREHHPAKSIKVVELLGSKPAKHGERLLVRVIGEDSHGRANTIWARIASESDPKGFVRALRETGPRTGEYVGMFTIAQQTDAATGALRAARHDERITVTPLSSPAKSATVKYADVVPPSPPNIKCPTHPSRSQDTFEQGLSEWANIGGTDGALLTTSERIVGKQPAPVGRNTYLKLSKPEHRGHLGATARSTAFSAKQYPLVTFDYSISSTVKMDFDLQFGEDRLSVQFNDYGPHLRDQRLATIAGIKADGYWHHAELPLLSALRARDRWAADPRISDMRFINWDVSPTTKMKHGRTGGKGSYWGVDNFSILGYGAADARFEWTAQDASDIAGYSYVLDRQRDTMPPEKVMGKQTTLARKGLADGRWYLHVRALDGVGNWSRANHHMIIVDTAGPTAKVLGEEGAEHEAFRPIHVQFDDQSGAGVNPWAIRLRVAGEVYSIEDSALAYNAAKSLLTFFPPMARPHPLLFANGERVTVEVLTAPDHAGHPLREHVKTTFVMKSPLEAKPAIPDGENGWYVTMPTFRMPTPAGGKVTYTWDLPPKQDDPPRRGNSINRLTITTRDAKGKTRSYMRPLRLDTTVPKVTARRTKMGHIALQHDDYVDAPGGLNCTLYADEEMKGDSLCPPQTSDFALDAFPPNLRRKARSIRWHGKLRVPATDVYVLAIDAAGTQVLIDGEILLESNKLSQCEVLLKKGLHDIEVRRCGERITIPNNALAITWSSKAIKRGAIPLEAFYASKSVARIYYRWDEGPEREYSDPLAAPNGARVLHYRAIDEAGHRTDAGRLELGAP